MSAKRQEAVKLLARLIVNETTERDHLDGNIDAELRDFGDEVRERAWGLWKEEPCPLTQR